MTIVRGVSLLAAVLLVGMFYSGCSYCETQCETTKAKSEMRRPEPQRELRKHGYLVNLDIEKQIDEVRELREYTNFIFPYLMFDQGQGQIGRAHGIGPDILESLLPGKDGIVDEELYARIGRGLDMLDELDFDVMISLPFEKYVVGLDVEGYRAALQFLRKQLPQMLSVDYIYFVDEPDINALLSTEELGSMMRVFKEVFPEIKICVCYGLPTLEQYKAVPPDEIDLLAIDPYQFRGYDSSIEGYTEFYYERLGMGLQWVHQWGKPWLLVADAFRTRDNTSKPMPAFPNTEWFYHLALTQPGCMGLGWFYYGNNLNPETEDIFGVTFDSGNDEIIDLHKRIGKQILGEDQPIGLQGWQAPDLEAMREKLLAE